MPTAHKTKSGSWQVRTRVGGVQKSFTAKTKREAELKAVLYKNETLSSLTMGQAIDSYIKSKTNVLSPSSIRGYRVIERNYIDDKTKRIRVSDITNIQLQECVNLCAEHHSPKTTANTKGLLTAVLRMYRPEFKPLITLPAKQLNLIIIPSNEQILMIIDQIENTPLEIPVLLAAFGSLRASEVCALKKDCIFEDHISVRRSVVLNEKNEYITKNTPKSYAGYRDVYLPKDIMVKLQGIERATTYNPSSLTIAFRKVIKKLGLPEGIHFHSLRHYFATFCHAQGIPDKYIMKIGGWNNIDVLNKIYQHTTPAKEEAVSAQINDFYENLKK
jgi:integrase